MNDSNTQLDRIEKAVIQILEIVQNERSPIENKWLTEPQVMKILNLTVRGLAEIRRKNLIRCSSATGRNFKYYKADVEKYLYDYSSVKNRRKNSSKLDKGSQE